MEALLHCLWSVCGSAPLFLKEVPNRICGSAPLFLKEVPNRINEGREQIDHETSHAGYHIQRKIEAKQTCFIMGRNAEKPPLPEACM
jgi:hypothetical protein